MRIGLLYNRKDLHTEWKMRKRSEAEAGKSFPIFSSIFNATLRFGVNLFDFKIFRVEFCLDVWKRLTISAIKLANRLLGIRMEIQRMLRKIWEESCRDFVESCRIWEKIQQSWKEIQQKLT